MGSGDILLFIKKKIVVIKGAKSLKEKKKRETIKMNWMLCLYFAVGSIVSSYMGTVVILWIIRVFFPNCIHMLLQYPLSYPQEETLNNFIIPFNTFEFYINFMF